MEKNHSKFAIYDYSWTFSLDRSTRIYGSVTVIQAGQRVLGDMDLNPAEYSQSLQPIGSFVYTEPVSGLVAAAAAAPFLSPKCILPIVIHLITLQV